MEWNNEINKLPKLSAAVYLDKQHINFQLNKDESDDTNIISNCAPMMDGNAEQDLSDERWGVMSGAISDKEVFRDPLKPFADPNRNLTFITVNVACPNSTMSARTYMQVDSGAACNLITLEMATALGGGHKIDQTG